VNLPNSNLVLLFIDTHGKYTDYADRWHTQYLLKYEQQYILSFKQIAVGTNIAYK